MKSSYQSRERQIAGALLSVFNESFAPNSAYTVREGALRSVVERLNDMFDTVDAQTAQVRLKAVVEQLALLYQLQTCQEDALRLRSALEAARKALEGTENF